MAPLDGVKVVEFAGLGPCPFAAMLLAGMGATVVRLQRRGGHGPMALPGLGADLRGRPAVVVDLKDPADRDLALRLLDAGDAALEGFRPGVMERLGLGPDVALARNPRLVYGRVTGYGQHGPMAEQAGHDVNYLAMSGVLGALARPGERPMPPLNLLADYGGGGMLLAVGVLAALLEVSRGGQGQVVDAAMTDGVAQLATVVYGLSGAGSWGSPGTNLLDGGAPFYDVYETSDSRHVAVGAIEPQFYADLLRVLGIDPAEAPQWDRAGWPALAQRFARAFRTRPRDEWVALAAGSSACLTPVLSLSEAPRHPHHVARSAFTAGAGGYLPAAAPRFGSAPSAPLAPATPDVVLSRWGIPDAEIDRLRAAGSFGD